MNYYDGSIFSMAGSLGHKGPNTVSGSTVSNTELSEFGGSLSSGERTQ